MQKYSVVIKQQIAVEGHNYYTRGRDKLTLKKIKTYSNGYSTVS